MGRGGGQGMGTVSIARIVWDAKRLADVGLWQQRKSARNLSRSSRQKKLYRFLTGPTGTSHCPRHHKHTLRNCKLEGKTLICFVCKREDEDPRPPVSMS